MPWRIEDKNVERFFYLFMNGELEFLLSFFPAIRLLHRFFDGKNWCVEFEVLSPPC